MSLIALFFLGVFLSSLTTVPVIVSLIICSAIILRNPKVFILAILGGLITDIFFLRPLGVTALFLVVFAFLIFLYQRRFEINTVPFVFIGNFVGSMVYLMVFEYNQVLIQALINTVIGILLFRFVIPNSFRNLERNEILK